MRLLRELAALSAICAGLGAMLMVAACVMGGA